MVINIAKSSEIIINSDYRSTINSKVNESIKSITLRDKSIQNRREKIKSVEKELKNWSLK